MLCRGTDHRLHTDFAFIFGNWKLHFFTRTIDAKLGVKLNNCLVFKFLNKHVGIPENVDEYATTLEKHREYYEVGLTKPWV